MVADDQARPKVLIVDDQKNWRDVLRLCLQKQYDVATVQNLEDARAEVFQLGSPYAAAVIDISLDETDRSNCDGLELAREIQEQLNGLTSTILITGYPSVKTVNRVADLAAFRYLEKYPSKNDQPFHEAFRDAVSKAVACAAESRAQKAAMRVLVVEDDARWRDMLTKIVGSEGLAVQNASSAQEALTKVTQASYDLIILDLKLGSSQPEEGLELLDALVRMSTQARYIIVTGYSTNRLASTAFSARLQACVKGFLPKYPFDLPLFLEHLRRSTWPRPRPAGCRR